MFIGVQLIFTVQVAKTSSGIGRNDVFAKFVVIPFSIVLSVDSFLAAFDLFTYQEKLIKARVDRIERITTTMRSSTRVNAFVLCWIIERYLRLM
jgi:hypothetical protein